MFAPLIETFAGVERAAVIVVIAVVLTVVLGRLDQEKYFELALDCVPRDDADQFVDVSIGWKVDYPITGPATVIWWKSKSPPRESWEEHIILDIPEGVAMTGFQVIRGFRRPGQPEFVRVIYLEDGSALVLEDTGLVWAGDAKSPAGAIALQNIQASLGRTLCP